LPELPISYHDEVQTELKEIIDDRSLPLYRMLRYHMGWQDKHGYPCSKKSGKLIRPTLCLLSCQVVGGNTSQILPAAAALELIHNWSLIHDDIEDVSSERHHRPTVWKVWGKSQAINAGDVMFTLAYLALLRLRGKGVSEAKIVQAIRILSQACIELCEGQYLDITYENRLDITGEDYLDMIAKKTASLMAASTSLGAYLGTEDEKMVSCLYQFGKEIGLAYQIRDDILGIWGIEESTGKSVASDVSQRKKTLPVVYGLKNSKGEDRAKLLNRYSQKSIKGEDILEVVRILDQVGARDYAQNLAEQHYHQALAQLESAGLDISRQAPLREAARFLIKRDY